MKTIILALGILSIGAIQVSECLRAQDTISRQKIPGFRETKEITHLSPDFTGGITKEESYILKNIRKLYEDDEFEQLNALTEISPNEVEFSINPAKPHFSKGETPLAELRITNISERRIVVCEPRIRRMNKSLTYGDGYYEDIYSVDLYPVFSDWIRLLEPSESLSVPIMPAHYLSGENRIKYYLNSFKFHHSFPLGGAKSGGSGISLGTSICRFTIGPS